MRRSESGDHAARQASAHAALDDPWHRTYSCWQQTQGHLVLHLSLLLTDATDLARRAVRPSLSLQVRDAHVGQGHLCLSALP